MNSNSSTSKHENTSTPHHKTHSLEKEFFYNDKKYYLNLTIDINKNIEITVSDRLLPFLFEFSKNLENLRNLHIFHSQLLEQKIVDNIKKKLENPDLHKWEFKDKFLNLTLISKLDDDVSLDSKLELEMKELSPEGEKRHMYQTIESMIKTIQTQAEEIQSLKQCLQKQAAEIEHIKELQSKMDYKIEKLKNSDYSE